MYISPKIKHKLLDQHNVKENEVEECFVNREGDILDDTREAHKTSPKTQWFIAETYYGRRLKVVFMVMPDNVTIKSAFEPNITEEQLYKSKSNSNAK